jgi:integrase
MLRPAAPRSGFFERDEFEAVCAQLPSDIELAARLGFTYGFRITSEVLPLTKAQVDLQAGKVMLYPGMTKGGEGRLIFLTPELKIALADQLDRVRALEGELSMLIPWVFPLPHGPSKGSHRRRICWTWRKACQRAGMPGRWKHDLRRTAVRNLVNAGVSERVAMKITGHKTRSIFDRYHVVSPGDLRNAMRKITQAQGVQNGAQRPEGGAVPP